MPNTCTNWTNLAMFLLNTVLTFVANTGVFGSNPGEISAKYQLVITPATWAFAIWGPIFIWEGIFTLAQLSSSYNTADVVRQVSPWWWSTCVFQALWSLTFNRELIGWGLVCMVGILISLFGLLFNAPWPQKTDELWLLRLPFSLHAGWILAATSLNVGVLADSLRVSPAVSLALAMGSLAVIFAIVAIIAVQCPGPDPVVAVSAGWALAGIYAELGNPTRLLNPNRFNFFEIDQDTIGGLRGAAGALSLGCTVFFLLAITLRLRGGAVKSNYGLLGASAPASNA